MIKPTPSHARSLPDSGLDPHGPAFYERHYSGRDGKPTHTHEETYLIFLLEGVVEETRQRQTRLRTPSMLTVLPAGEPHATHFSKDVRTLEIALPSPWITRLGRYSSMLERYENHEDGLPVWFAKRLYREFQQQDSATPLMLEALLLELLAQLARETIYGADKRVPRWLLQARDYVHSHFTDPLSVEEIAHTVNIHPAHLVRAFRQHFGGTLGDLIRTLRLEMATSLLVSSELTIAQIALQAGFADQSHFCRLFKSRTGMTPSHYQKAMGVQIQEKQ